ncbi:outer membrane protein assembly factor BamA [Curvibacter sp. CHRR-16]|uniref:outer membrane protein assembly factor BamA n=1 Tax=Curvibacter sp. CHRR-16 TaxID=2835872 RepID=UPI0020239212|nr:outer membrane protein assembly factor BamA [Curvibacter sp. CHRR-16]
MRWIAGAVIGSALTHAAWALDPFVVQDIRVEGLQRVEPGTVFASIALRAGDTYTDEKASSAIRSLYSLGLFKDVRIEAKGDVLVVVVEERPVVADVDFVGLREFDKDTLKKALKEIGLTDGRPLDKSLVDKAEQELKRQYISKSMYSTEVVTTITPLERNRVNISFAVVEGETAKIRSIHIVGSKGFSESDLLDQLDMNTGNWLSWYTKSNRFSRAKFNADLETLRSYYLSQGYLEFKVDSTQVEISPDKTAIDITINVSEGAKYVVSGIRLAGNYLGKEPEFQSLITIKAGGAYNINDVTKTTKAFTDYFANFGYAFARTEVRTDIDRSNNTVALTLVSEPSRRVYVRRINVAGNDRTRDEVIRREFRQFEASWYDGQKIRVSRERVNRLGYFTDVSIDTQEVPDSPDQVDLLVTVAEKPTGSVSLGAGVSSADGLGLTFGFKQDNAFGSGNSLGLELNTSKTSRTTVLSTTNPYFTEDGVSRTFDLYQRTYRPYSDYDSSSYGLETDGVSMRFGLPVSDNDTIYLGVGAEKNLILDGTYMPTVYTNYVDSYGYSAQYLPLTLGWTRDTRDSALVPSSGGILRTSAEWSVGGDTRYARGTLQMQRFVEVTRKVTFALNTELSVGASTGDRAYPIFKNYYLGGLGSVRGYEQSTLTTGTQRDAGSTYYGGTKRVVVNTEWLTPLPGGGYDKSLRAYFFMDAGGIYGENEDIKLQDMRSSMGVGISWISPVGPLRIAFAQPLSHFSGDKIQNIQFQIGTSF